MSGIAAAYALTMSSCPSIAAEKIVGGAPCSMQELGDRPVSDVRRRPERGFPVAESPIPRRLRERRMRGDELLHAREISVRDADDLPREMRVMARK